MSHRGAWIAVVSGLLFLIAAFAGILVASFQDVTQSPWTQYDLYGMPESQITEETIQALVNSPDVLSYYTVTVWIQDFVGGEWVRLSRLTERLEKVDPRMDPFLKSLPILFEAEVDGQEYQVVYVPAKAGDAAAAVPPGFDRLNDAWARGGPGPSNVVGALLVPLSLVGMIWLLRMVQPVPLVTAVLFSLFGITWGSLGIVQAELLFVAWLLLYRVGVRWIRSRAAGRPDPWDRSVFVIAGYALAGAVLISFGLPTATGLQLLHATAMVAFVIGLAVISLGIEALVLLHMDHVPLTVLPLMRRTIRDRIGRISPFRFWMVVVLLTVTPIVTSVIERAEPGASDTTVPIPVDGETIETSATAITMKAYLSHRAYQLAIPYGRSFVEPTMGEEVSLRRFSLEDGALKEYNETVIRFDSDWFNSVMNDVPPRSVYRLFVRESPEFGFAVQHYPSAEQKKTPVEAHVAAPLLLVLPGVFLYPRFGNLRKGSAGVSGIVRVGHSSQ